MGVVLTLQPIRSRSSGSNLCVTLEFQTIGLGLGCGDLDLILTFDDIGFPQGGEPLRFLLLRHP